MDEAFSAAIASDGGGAFAGAWNSPGAADGSAVVAGVVEALGSSSSGRFASWSVSERTEMQDAAPSAASNEKIREEFMEVQRTCERWSTAVDSASMWRGIAGLWIAAA
jgi:hypothetical protein